MALTAPSRMPANEPVVDGGGRPTTAWGAFFQEVSDYLTAQSERFDELETNVDASDAALAALALVVAGLVARPLVKSGSLVLTLDINGDAFLTFPAPFPTTLHGATVCFAAKAFAPGVVFYDAGTSDASGLAVAVRPNPGAVAVEVAYVAVGS